MLLHIVCDSMFLESELLAFIYCDQGRDLLEAAVTPEHPVLDLFNADSIGRDEVHFHLQDDILITKRWLRVISISVRFQNRTCIAKSVVMQATGSVFGSSPSFGAAAPSIRA